jgi:ribosomal protein L16 Arg81 hydroxylase
MTVEQAVARSAVDRIFDPVGRAAFLDDYWEARPLFVARGDHNYFASLFSLDAFDALLARGDLWHPNVRVFLAGEQLDHSRYAKRWAYGRERHDRLIDVEKLLELFRRGATLNVLGLERTNLEVMNLSKELEVEAGFPVHTTAFMSPPSAVNVPPHFDMTDVIVTQVHGSKIWNVWQPTRARPLVSDTAGRLYERDSQVVSEEMRVGRYELQAGDSLYVPRGFLHEAITTTESSLHLAFGINVHRWYDVVEEAASRALASLAGKPEYRRALPVRTRAPAPPSRAAIAEMVDAMEADVRGGLASALAAALRALDIKYLAGRAPARPGQLTDIEGIADLSLDDLVVLRPRLAFGIENADGRIRLIFHRKELSLARELESPLRTAASGERIRIRDLPNLSPARQLTFARTLVLDGFLTVVKNATGLQPEGPGKSP